MYQIDGSFMGLEYGRYGISKVLDMAYWGFLRVGTTFDIFQNILFPYSLNTAYHLSCIRRIRSCFFRGLWLPLPKFFCDVLEYFHVHVSKLNRFGCAKLTTFTVMCKAYGGEPTVELFRSFFNLDCPEVLSKDNRWDKRSFKDKIPPSIYENPFYQRLSRHLVNVRTFPDLILFLAGLKTLWDHGQQRPAIFVGGKGTLCMLKMMKTSPSTSINNKPPLLEAEPLDGANPEQLVENTANFGGSPACEGMRVIGTGSVAGRMKDRSEVSHLTISDDEEGLPKAPELRTAINYHLMISNSVVDNVVNQRARELLKVMDQMKGKCDVLKEREKSRDVEYEELRLKCKATMTEFDNNPAVNVLCQKIKSLTNKMKEHKASMDRILLESKKWIGYQENLANMESKVAALEDEKSRLEVAEATLHQEVKGVKGDRLDVVSKVVPYVAMELVHSNEMAMLVWKLVSSAVFYARCATFEDVCGHERALRSDEDERL
ncbi:hypothetical protein Tco_0553019 [Tanacetum coccineum]